MGTPRKSLNRPLGDGNRNRTSEYYGKNTEQFPTQYLNSDVLSSLINQLNILSSLV